MPVCVACNNDSLACVCNNRSRSRERSEKEQKEKRHEESESVPPTWAMSMMEMMKSVKSEVSEMKEGMGKQVQDLKSEIKVTSERLDVHDGRLDGQDQRISQLEAKAAENSSTHAKPQHQQVVTPYELRTIAVIGNLGWDSPSSELMDRAKKVLADAGVSGETYSNLCAITFKGDKGSSVQLCFQNPSLLQHASLAVRALRQSFSEGRFVYLDVRKEQAERRPARVVSRMADFMADVEAGMEPPLAIEKVMNGKFVKVGGKRIGFTFKGEWKWTDYAISRYSGAVMQTAKEFAEGE